MLNNPKKIAIVITDGVGFRNFAMSDFMSKIEQHFDLISIYSGLPISVFENIKMSSKIEVIELQVFEEKKLTWFFRKWKEIAHLKKFETFAGMQENLALGYPKNNRFSSLLIKIIYGIIRFWHSNSSMIFAERLQFLTFSRHRVTKSYLKLLEVDKPDLVFFTHQRPSYIAMVLDN